MLKGILKNIEYWITINILICFPHGVAWLMYFLEKGNIEGFKNKFIYANKGLAFLIISSLVMIFIYNKKVKKFDLKLVMILQVIVIAIWYIVYFNI